ncbi:hypothetical protein CGRA01v4_09015 [Colletotrichum graminicola]|nr:hypothetical protein CGRA01v4_09015 [Colletotrichum graminicola]
MPLSRPGGPQAEQYPYTKHQNPSLPAPVIYRRSSESQRKRIFGSKLFRELGTIDSWTPLSQELGSGTT